MTTPDERPPSRILLADDHELAREALRSVLARQPDLEVVGEARDGGEAVELARRLRPDLVLMDVRMPGLDGLSATRSVLAALPATRVVILSAYENREYVLEALRAGATGYLLKGATKQEVIATLRGALAGEVHVQPEIAGRLLRQLAHSGPPSGNHDLTAREIAVLRLMARGRTNEAIGRELHLTLNTVKTHVAHILRKLDAADRAEAVARGAALGLIDDPLMS
jgi:DNA-binding NarL/FixJ family response regulator